MEWPSSDDDDPAWLDDDDPTEGLVAAGGHRLVLEGLDTQGTAVDVPPQSLSSILRLTSAWLPLILTMFLCSQALLPAQVRSAAGNNDGPSALASLCGIGIGTTVVFAPLISILSDRLFCAPKVGRRRAILLAGVTVFAISQIVMGVSNQNLPDQQLYSYAWTVQNCTKTAPPPMDEPKGNLWLIYLAFIVVVIGYDFVFVPYLAMVLENTHPAQRGLVSGILGALFAGGLLLAITVAQGLAHVTIIGAYLIGAVWFALAVALSITLKNNDRPGSRIQNYQHSAYVRAFIGPFRDPDLAWATCARFLLQLAAMIVIFFEQDFLDDLIQLPHGMHAHKASYIVLLFMLLASIVVSSLFGHLSDRIRSRRKVFVLIGIALMAATSGVMAVLRDYYAIVVFKIVFGLGYGTYLSVDFALMADSVTPDPDRARDVAFWQNAFVVPLLLARPVGGEIRDAFIRTGHRCAIGYTAMFVMVAGLFVLSGISIVRARRLA